jgi:hypothetical protein
MIENAFKLGDKVRLKCKPAIVFSIGIIKYSSWSQKIVYGEENSPFAPYYETDLELVPEEKKVEVTRAQIEQALKSIGPLISMENFALVICERLGL